MAQIRFQLTLFVPQPEADLFENIRKQYNPEQHALIAAHATLCREDEIADLDTVRNNLKTGLYPALSVNFGLPARFSEFRGLMLPAAGPNETYHTLRKQILTGAVEQPRYPEPHITLMHPRNSTCTDEIFGKITRFRFPNSIVFREIALIRQENGGVWEVLEQFKLI